MSSIAHAISQQVLIKPRSPLGRGNDNLRLQIGEENVGGSLDASIRPVAATNVLWENRSTIDLMEILGVSTEVSALDTDGVSAVTTGVTSYRTRRDM